MDCYHTHPAAIYDGYAVMQAGQKLHTKRGWELYTVHRKKAFRYPVPSRDVMHLPNSS